MKTSNTVKNHKFTPMVTAAIVFVLTAVVAAALVFRLELYRLQEERARYFNHASDHAVALELHLERAMSASYALAALVRQGNGTVRDFEGVGRELLSLYPGVAALQLVPDGIVRKVVPLEGNEGAIGHNVLEDPARTKEAFLARETGKLTLAGPFNLVQGGAGAVARLPVYLDDVQGEKHFWGFTSVIIRFPDVLAPAQFSELAERGVAYELWRIHPDTRQKQSIAASSSAPLKDPVQKTFVVPNGKWTLSVAPISGWSNPVGVAIKTAVGLFFCLLLAWLAKLLVEARIAREGLEALVAERTAEIQEKEERLRLLADNLPESYVYQYTYENGGPRFLQVSAGVERLHGIRREDVLQDATVLHSRIDPEQLPDLSAAENFSKLNMTDFRMEVRARLADGKYGWLQLRSRPRLRGEQVIWDGVATDITERKETEEALRNERDFSDAVLNSLPAVFYMFDRDFKFLRWNDKFLQAVGCTSDQITRLNALDVVAPEDREKGMSHIEEAFAHGAADVKAGLVGKNGSATTYYLTGTTTTIFGKYCLLGVGLDITGQQLAEKALEDARALAVQKSNFLEAVMDALPVGVANVDTQGEFIQMNRAFKEVWGGSRPLPAIPTESKVWWVETGQPVQPEEFASARAVHEGEKVVGQLLRIERADGSRAYIHNSAAPFHDSHGTIAGCAVAVMDMTEEMEIKESLRQAKEAAEAADSAKSQFLANVSHELRTPMAGILGMLQLALQEQLPSLTRQYLENTVTSANALLRILNDILDMTNISRGMLAIEEKPFILADFATEAVNMFTIEATRKGLDLRVSLGDDVPRAVVGDERRLRQVMLNLVGNAVKFTKKGTIELKISAGGASTEGKKDVTFTVSDTGIGIPEGKKELIFRTFSQVDTSHSRMYGGMGLGLSISYRIIQLMGGTLSFESTEGLGSTFFFTIPLAEGTGGSGAASEKLSSVETTSSKPVAKTMPHILVVDDDETIRTFLMLMLQRSGYSVSAAEDGVQAVEMWEKDKYDTVLMDIQMPRLDGYEATHRIREMEQERGGHTPIVAVTAHASDKDVEKCLAAGMDAFIAKPVDFKKLIGVIGKTRDKNVSGG